MSFLGTLCLWAFAIFGVVCLIAILCTSMNEARKKILVDPTPRPPVQITNLRTIPEPAPKIDPNQPQILQKTSMEITTTKYVDPNAKAVKEISKT